MLDTLAGSTGDTASATPIDETPPDWLAAPSTDTDHEDWRLNFAALKWFMLDVAYFEALFDQLKGVAFDLNLGFGILAVLLWLILTTIPATLEDP